METGFAFPRAARRRLLAAFAASGIIHLALFLPSAPLSPSSPPLVVHLPEPRQPLDDTSFETLPAMLTTQRPTEAAVSTADKPPHQAAFRPRLLPRALQERVLAELARDEFYPREAIAQGLEGRVVLLLTVAGDGRVSRIAVARSSGHALLDRAALSAATRLQRLPGGARDVLLPVDFVLE